MPHSRGFITIENMFYGADPNRRMGQEVLGKTSGISDETEREIVEFCNSWGDCRNLNFRRSLNQFPLKGLSRDGETLMAVVKVLNAGRDSLGREGTLVRHALIIRESDYRRIEYNPFTLESQGVFLSAGTRLSYCREIIINTGQVPPSDLSEIPRAFFDSLFDYLHTILSGGEIFLFLNNHLNSAEEIIYHIFKILPIDVRPRLAVTTFAFRKNLNYKIGCYYRQSGVAPDPLKVRFEISGEKDEATGDFLRLLFECLRDERYGRVLRMLADSNGV
jgi:hypothetical protein